MPLRYLQLREPVYTPSYNPIDLSVASGIVDTIGARADSALDARRTLGDNLRENIQTGLANLRPEDQMFAQNQLFNIEQGIDDYINEHGASRSLDYISRQAREFSQAIAPLTQRAQYGRQLQEIMNESEADSLAKSFVLGQVGEVDYDPDTGLPQDWRGQANQRDVETIKNWKNLTDVIDKFNNGWKASSYESAQFGGGQQFSDETITYFREKVETLGYGDVEAANIAFMLNDPQLRAQLDLMGRAEIESYGEQSNISVGNDGRVRALTPVPKLNANNIPLNEDGLPAENESDVAYMVKEVTFDSIAHWQATKQAAPYAMREAYEKISYDTRNANLHPSGPGGRGAGGGSPMAGYRFNTLVDYVVEEMDANEFYAEASEQAKQIAFQGEIITSQVNGILRDFVGENENFYASFEDGNMIIHDGNKSYALDEDIPNIPANTLSTLRDLESSFKHANNRALNLERDLKRIENSVLNKLGADPKYAGLAEAASFGDNSEINFDAEILSKYVDVYDFNPISITDRDSFNVNIDSIREGEVVSAIRAHTPRAFGAVTGEGRQISETRGFLYNDYGEIKWIPNNSELLSDFRNKARELQQENINVMRGVGVHNMPGIVLDGTSTGTIDRIFMDHIESGRLTFGEQGGFGDLVDSSGNMIKWKNGYKLQSSTVSGGPDGQPTIGVKIVDAEDNTVNSNARITGAVVDDAARKLWGEDYRNYMRVNYLQSLIPNIIDNVNYTDNDDKFKITPQMMAFLVGRPSSLKESLDIRMQRLRNENDINDTFIVNYKGNPYYAFSSDHLDTLLLAIEAVESGEEPESILSQI